MKHWHKIRIPLFGACSNVYHLCGRMITLSTELAVCETSYMGKIAESLLILVQIISNFICIRCSFLCDTKSEIHQENMSMKIIIPCTPILCSKTGM